MRLLTLRKKYLLGCVRKVVQACKAVASAMYREVGPILQGAV